MQTQTELRPRVFAAVKEKRISSRSRAQKKKILWRRRIRHVEFGGEWIATRLSEPIYNRKRRFFGVRLI